jgi:hypothetical protein
MLLDPEPSEQNLKDAPILQDRFDLTFVITRQATARICVSQPGADWGIGARPHELEAVFRAFVVRVILTGDAHVVER